MCLTTLVCSISIPSLGVRHGPRVLPKEDGQCYLAYKLAYNSGELRRQLMGLSLSIVHRQTIFRVRRGPRSEVSGDERPP
jgi:hypothetical protein